LINRSGERYEKVTIACGCHCVACCLRRYDPDPTALTGTAAGAGVGAIAGAIGGNAGLGAAAGQAPACSAGFSSINPGRPRTEPFSRALQPDNSVGERLAAAG